ncbi:hypothetical protein B0H13DRAFT_2666320 [Mycena leptocephala]|nr:hypothetical protein B0H13DRAFT_2666320 [Mycena leptocephala]
MQAQRLASPLVALYFYCSGCLLLGSYLSGFFFCAYTPTHASTPRARLSPRPDVPLPTHAPHARARPRSHRRSHPARLRPRPTPRRPAPTSNAAHARAHVLRRRRARPRPRPTPRTSFVDAAHARAHVDAAASPTFTSTTPPPACVSVDDAAPLPTHPRPRSPPSPALRVTTPDDAAPFQRRQRRPLVRRRRPPRPLLQRRRRAAVLARAHVDDAAASPSFASTTPAAAHAALARLHSNGVRPLARVHVDDASRRRRRLAWGHRDDGAPSRAFTATTRRRSRAHRRRRAHAPAAALTSCATFCAPRSGYGRRLRNAALPHCLLSTTPHPRSTPLLRGSSPPLALIAPSASPPRFRLRARHSPRPPPSRHPPRSRSSPRACARRPASALALPLLTARSALALPTPPPCVRLRACRPISALVTPALRPRSPPRSSPHRPRPRRPIAYALALVTPAPALVTPALALGAFAHVPTAFLRSSPRARRPASAFVTPPPRLSPRLGLTRSSPRARRPASAFVTPPPHLSPRLSPRPRAAHCRAAPSALGLVTPPPRSLPLRSRSSPLFVTPPPRSDSPPRPRARCLRARARQPGPALLAPSRSRSSTHCRRLRAPHEPNALSTRASRHPIALPRSSLAPSSCTAGQSRRRLGPTRIRIPLARRRAYGYVHDRDC